MSYPTDFDEFVDPTRHDQHNAAAVPHWALEAAQNAAIRALQVKLGIDSDPNTNSVDYRLGGVSVLTASAVLDYGDIGAGAVEDKTITVTGAEPGDVVSLGLPDASVSPVNVAFTAWVSAADTVTIRAHNIDGAVSSGDLPSGTFRVLVTKWV